MKKPTLYTYRRALQIAVALAFVLIPYLNSIRISYVHGNFLSFNFFGMPLADPLAVLQIILKNGYFSADLLIGAGVALLLAAILGTVFCSWVCPFGLLSEWTHGISKKIKLGRVKSSRRSKKKRRHGGFRYKMILFVLGLTGFLIFSTTPVLNQLSMPAWYSRIFQFLFVQNHVSLAIWIIIVLLLLELLLSKRIWCRYVCPQAVLLVLAKQLNPHRLKVGFEPKACTCKKGKQPCAYACTLDLNPRRLQRHGFETECTNCADCITECKNHGKALEFLPIFGKSPT